MKKVIRLPSRRFIHIVSVVTLALLLSCCRKHAPRQMVAVTREKPSITNLMRPAQDTVTHSGDSLLVTLARPASGNVIDSLVLYSGKDKPVSIKGNREKFNWHVPENTVGPISLKVSVYYNDSLEESHSVNLVVLSDLVPATYNYRVVNQYPHDADAYTQGLIYDHGILYESTGLEGKSSIRIVNINTGKPLKLIPMANQYFGEGIALYKDDLYQITYKSQVGFVYDKNTLEQIRSFDYPLKEGWGLTTDGKYLVMSDGSDKLYFVEPEFFSQVGVVSVFDNTGMVSSLNELEYINGKILANVYGESYIVIIDPESGKVTGKLDLKGLMPKGSEGDMNKVLNGIAYNPQTHHLYVTGKEWPVLYEIEVKPAL